MQINVTYATIWKIQHFPVILRLTKMPHNFTSSAVNLSGGTSLFTLSDPLGINCSCFTRISLFKLFSELYLDFCSTRLWECLSTGDVWLTGIKTSVFPNSHVLKNLQNVSICKSISLWSCLSFSATGETYKTLTRYLCLFVVDIPFDYTSSLQTLSTA